MKRTIIADYRLKPESLKILEQLCDEIILVTPNKSFDEAVASHPDMNYLQIKDTVFTTNVRSGSAVRIYLPEKGILKYPDDVLLNALCVENDFICRKKSVFPRALEYAAQLGMRIIDVNQGYVKCNIAVVNARSKAIITEDAGISNILRKYGYDVLLLEHHAVKLPPYPYGFIGGATGLIDGTLYFTGNISRHPEYHRIKAFCSKYETKIISLQNTDLYDMGSILIMHEE